MRFALGLCAVTLADMYYSGDTDRALHVVRDFLGTTLVTTNSMGRINGLYSGNTSFLITREGPFRQVTAMFNAAPANPRLPVIGLGVGAMPSNSQPAQEWTFTKSIGGILAFHVSNRTLNLKPILAGLAEQEAHPHRL